MNATIETILENAGAVTHLGSLQSVCIFPNGTSRALYEYGSVNYNAEGAVQAPSLGSEDRERLLRDSAAGKLVTAQ